MSGHQQRPVFSAHFRTLDSAFRAQYSKTRSSSPFRRLLFTSALTAVLAIIVVIAVLMFAVMLLGFFILRLIRRIQSLFRAQPETPRAAAWTPDFPRLQRSDQSATGQQSGTRTRIIEIRATDSSDSVTGT